MLERVIMAGFGGQGMMFIGKLLAQAVMEEDCNVTFFPSYGAEVRGGTAHCHVVISSKDIASPVIQTADTIIIMNQPSYNKFIPRLKEGGLVLANSTMVNVASDDNAVELPVTQMAADMGNVRVANIVMLGAYNQLRSTVDGEVLLDCLKRALTGTKADLFDINRQALEKGAAAATK